MAWAEQCLALGELGDKSGLCRQPATKKMIWLDMKEHWNVHRKGISFGFHIAMV